MASLGADRPGPPRVTPYGGHPNKMLFSCRLKWLNLRRTLDKRRGKGEGWRAKNHFREDDDKKVVTFMWRKNRVTPSVATPPMTPTLMMPLETAEDNKLFATYKCIQRIRISTNICCVNLLCYATRDATRA